MVEEDNSTASISPPTATEEGEKTTNDDYGLEAFSRLNAPIPAVDDDDDDNTRSTSSSMRSFLNFLASYDSTHPETRSSSGDDAPRDCPAASCHPPTSNKRQSSPPAPPGKRSGCKAIGDKVNSSM